MMRNRQFWLRSRATNPYGNELGGFTVVDTLSNETVHWQIGGSHPDSEAVGSTTRTTPIKDGRSAMTDDLDIYRAAKLVIDRHGEDAALFAEARAVVLEGEGDVEGGAIWWRIKAAG